MAVKIYFGIKMFAIRIKLLISLLNMQEIMVQQLFGKL